MAKKNTRYLIRFPEETLIEAIDAHVGPECFECLGFDTMEEAEDYIFHNDPESREADVVPVTRTQFNQYKLKHEGRIRHARNHS